MLKDRSILLGVTGGIAAYKSAELCRLLVKAGARVEVIMSRAACEFITPLTLETLCGHSAHVEMFGQQGAEVAHIALADAAELFIVAPATADYLARCAQGRASDLISAVTLAYKGQMLVAPAMNTNMLENPATRRNLAILEASHGWRFVQPGSGDLACGWTGPGRMADPGEILAAATALFDQDLQGRSLLVTAGPTVEDIDPVRFLSNRSSGKMGYSLARVAASRGADVTLVSGPTSLGCPPGVTRVPVRSAMEMRQAVLDRAGEFDAVVMAAAVADFRPLHHSDRKLKKSKNETERVLELVRNPDILAELGELYAKSERPVRVGFALETENLADGAKKKLASKKANLIVANLAEHGFSGEDNEALIVDDNGLSRETGRLTKNQLASDIVDLLVKRWAPSTE